jgi:hypothetical protein
MKTENQELLNSSKSGNKFKTDVMKSVCNVDEKFISCSKFDDKSKIGCVYCKHFKQTVS